MPFTYEYPRAALTVDCVVFGFDEAELKVLLIRRGLAPFKGKWALPGGFVRVDETVDEAARRELLEETGLKDVFLEQLYTFGTVDRDPRERVVSVAYFALVELAKHPATGATDASEAEWFPAAQPPALAFDHAQILETASQRLRGKVRYEPIGFELLPEKFTLSQLQHLYEAVLQTEADKRNFRKKILGMELLIPLKEQVRKGAHRPAQLFRFDARKYAALKKRGFNFEL
ncbi:MAG TPA: NUDIX domain-containing protein [Chthoniobacter sp.]|jgi:8-oxo-dGTP diphosphatase